MTTFIPLVEYLKLDDEPHLVAHECVSCGARFFDRRNACAACGKTEFADAAVPTVGTVKSFTIVHRAAPGIPLPFVAALIDCEGTSVRANLINVEPDPAFVRTGMKVQITTTQIGTDADGGQAVGFAFEPVN